MWRAHLTQTRLANAMSIDSTSLGKKLRGERGWALQEMIDAAAALKTTIAYLAGETEDPEPPRPGDRVGPAGLEPTTSTVEQSTIATVHSLAEARSRKAHTQSMATTAS